MTENRTDVIFHRLHVRVYAVYRRYGAVAKAEEVRQYVLKAYGIDLKEWRKA